ncbi:MAG: aldo/keto reductase, partial [Chloroflexi bacterium]|nr:aldo/keto reductase [Chloroflexota bacterium]
MEYRRLGRTGLKVSEFCLGTMTFRWTSTEHQSYQVLDRAFEAGINFIDTADVYSRWAPGNSGGVAEQVIGNWLRTKPRDQVVIATKVFGRMGPGPNDEGLSRRHIFSAVENSLRRLGVDYIDLYQVHRPDWETPLDETLHALDDLVTAGKVRYIGASNFAAWHLMK